MEKIRIGFGLGTNSYTNDTAVLGPMVDDLERYGYDSVWFSEKVAGANYDPIVAMTWAAARTQKLKFGPSVMVVPGRNPVLLAKSLASLDRISNGRLLPAFGLGSPNLGEHQAFGVDRSERAGWFNEALPLLRRLWTEDVVDHNGDRFQLEGVRVRPNPIQDPLEIWLGGIAKTELRRTGELGDGWLPSFCTPDDVSAAIPVIDQHSVDADRPLIDRGHFGALVAYTVGGSIPDPIVKMIETRRPEMAPSDIVVQGRGGLSARIEEFVDAGASKFVLMPFSETVDWQNELGELADAVLHFHDA